MMPERTLHETPPRQPWRFLFYDAVTLWFAPGQPTIWRLSWSRSVFLAVVVIFGLFMAWAVVTATERTATRTDTFATECAERQGGVYKIGDEKVCVDKTGRIIWLDSQRANQ